MWSFTITIFMKLHAVFFTITIFMKLHISLCLLYQKVWKIRFEIYLRPQGKHLRLPLSRFARNSLVFDNFLTDNCYTAFHETPAIDLVADTRSPQMAGRADLSST